ACVVGACLLIAVPLARADALGYCYVDRVGHRASRRGLSLDAGALNLAQCAVELFIVRVLGDTEAALFEAHADEVAGRAEGVVEAREFFAVWHRAFGRRGEEGVEFLQTRGESRAKAFLFEANHALDEFARGFEFGVGFAYEAG